MPTVTVQATPTPAVGKHVLLTLRNRSAYPAAPKTFTLDGDVVNTPRWETAPGTFAVYVGNDSPVRIRIVRMQDLISINGVAVSAIATAKVAAVQAWAVPGSKKGDVYTVSRNGQNWRCTCAGFTFRHTCRHIDSKRLPSA